MAIRYINVLWMEAGIIVYFDVIYSAAEQEIGSDKELEPNKFEYMPIWPICAL